MTIHYYLLANPTYEKNRYDNLIQGIQENGIQNYTVFTHCWASDITYEIRKKYVKTDTSMKYHGRNMNQAPLNNAEISLFLNHIECLKSIRENYKEGLFALLESDTMFHADFANNMRKVVELAKDIEWDIINFGGGSGHYKPISEPLRNSLHLYKELKNNCSDGILWNYASVCKFLDYFEQTEDIDGPIDTKIDVLSEFLGGFNIYWAYPSLTYQGSFTGLYRSHIR